MTTSNEKNKCRKVNEWEKRDMKAEWKIYHLCPLLTFSVSSFPVSKMKGDLCGPLTLDCLDCNPSAKTWRRVAVEFARGHPASGAWLVAAIPKKYWASPQRSAPPLPVGREQRNSQPSVLRAGRQRFLEVVVQEYTPLCAWAGDSALHSRDCMSSSERAQLFWKGRVSRGEEEMPFRSLVVSIFGEAWKSPHQKFKYWNGKIAKDKSWCGLSVVTFRKWGWV